MLRNRPEFLRRSEMWAYNQSGQRLPNDSIGERAPRTSYDASLPTSTFRLKVPTDTFAFVSKAGKLVERCTRRTYATEPWDLFMGVVDEVNTTQKGTQDVIRAIRARLANSIPEVVALALSLLETCVANCHREFVKEAVTPETLRYFRPLCYSMGIEGTRARVLLQKWYLGFMDYAGDFRCIYDTHAELRMNDVEFPALDPGSVSPISLEGRPPPPAVSELAPFLNGPPQDITGDVETVARGRPQRRRRRRARSPKRVTPTDEQIKKLRGDMDAVRGNIHYLVELLSSLPAGDPPESSSLVMTLKQSEQPHLEIFCVTLRGQEIYNTNQAMRDRLVELVQRIENQDLIGVCRKGAKEALTVLDKLAVAFSLFEDAQKEYEALQLDSPESSSTFSLDMTPDSSAIASFARAGEAYGYSAEGVESVSSAMGALQLGTSRQSLDSIDRAALRRAISTPSMGVNERKPSTNHRMSSQRNSLVIDGSGKNSDSLLAAPVSCGVGEPMKSRGDEEGSIVALHGVSFPDGDASSIGVLSHGTGTAPGAEDCSDEDEFV